MNFDGRKAFFFNNAINTFYLRLYGVRHMVKNLLIVRKETRCRHMSYSFRLTGGGAGLGQNRNKMPSIYTKLCKCFVSFTIIFILLRFNGDR